MVPLSNVQPPTISRRSVLGAMVSMLWPSRLLQGEEIDVQMIAVTGEGAKYWSRWRGPSGQGIAEGSGFPDMWSSTQNVQWKTTVPGRGNSSPIVWGDRIFLTTAREGGRRLSVLAFRRSDG